MFYKLAVHDWGIERELYEELFQFIQNRKIEIEQGNNKDAIYVEMTWPDMASDILKKMEVAFELAQKTGFQIFAICDRKRNQLTQLLRCARFSLFFENYYIVKFPMPCIQAFFCALGIMCRIKSGDEMLRIRCKGILIGDCIYTDILRHAPQVYTIENVIWKRDFPVLLKALVYFNCVFTQFEKYQPRYFILGEYCYLQGIYVRVAQRFGAKMYDCVISQKIVEIPKIKGDCQPNFHAISKYYIEQRRMKEKLSQSEVNYVVEQLLRAKFRGEGNKDTVCAFAGKKKIILQDLKNEMGLNPQYKNIIIMCHCFSDNAHSCDELIFNDYYIWLKETLKTIRNIKDVNWIVRAHPSRRLYGESDEVWKLFKQYQSDCMFYFPEEYSGEMVKELADVIITVEGTAGYEYTCFGIPVVLAGKPFYSGYGYTIDVETKEGYKSILRNINDIEKLDAQQINMAREIYYYRDGLFDVENLFEKIFFENYQNFLKDRNMEKWNNKMISDYLDFKKNNFGFAIL